MKSSKKNVIYNTLYQSFTLLVPLITAPYLSRVIGPSGVGTYSYNYSIVNYFMLLCLLGLNNYGNRKIAQVRDYPIRLKKTFWSIFMMQLIGGVVTFGIYAIFLIFFSEYKQISILLIPFLISAIVDVSWFYFGTENFKAIIIRNTVVKLMSLMLIFIFVKSPDDLWKYTLIMSCSTLLSQIILWPSLIKKIPFYLPKKKEITKHIKPNLVLFIPVIAVSIYKIMDKVMLGIISGVVEVAYYENAEKIVHIPVVIIAALGTAMLPRMSNLLSKGNKKTALVYIKKSMRIIMFMSLPMMFGLVAIGRVFAPFYFGNEFIKTGDLIILLSITLPFLAFANVIRTQYLIPTESDSTYIKSVFLGAIINFIINAIFIPFFASTGACIGTILAEVSVMAYQTFKVRKILPVAEYFKFFFEYLFKSLIMFSILLLINFLNISAFPKLALHLFCGGSVYFLLNFNFIKDTFMHGIKLTKKR